MVLVRLSIAKTDRAKTGSPRIEACSPRRGLPRETSPAQLAKAKGQENGEQRTNLAHFLPDDPILAPFASLTYLLGFLRWRGSPLP